MMLEKRSSGMRCFRAATALLLFLAAGLSHAYADDFGPRHDIGSVRADAQRLLAHRARLASVDPKNIVLSDVVVVGDQAVLSWDIGKQHGFMGLIRNTNRWWDALDKSPQTGTACWGTTSAYPLRDDFSPNLIAAAETHNADSRRYRTFARCSSDVYDVKPDLSIKPAGTMVHLNRSETSGYDIAIRYAANDAIPSAKFQRVYVRPPTAAEFLPYPTPFHYVSDAVVFFDISIDAQKPVSFQKGGTFDVWFPFVLDDTLKYRLSFGGGQEPVGPIVGTIFDNVLHFDLPGFTALPGKELMGEIDGDLH